AAGPAVPPVRHRPVRRHRTRPLPGAPHRRAAPGPHRRRAAAGRRDRVHRASARSEGPRTRAADPRARANGRSPPMSIERALVVEDDELGRECVAESLAEIGIETRSAKNGRQAIEMLAKEDVDVILSDLRMPEVDGLALLRHARQNAPGTPFVLMTAFGTLDFAIQAMREGAEDILLKPFDPDQLALLLRRIESKQRLQRENQYLKREVEGGATGEIIGETQPIRAVLEAV